MNFEFLYLLKSAVSDTVKIGITNNVAERVISLRRDFGEMDLEESYLIVGQDRDFIRKLEGMLHLLFLPKKINMGPRSASGYSEWFHSSVQELALKYINGFVTDLGLSLSVRKGINIANYTNITATSMGCMTSIVQAMAAMDKRRSKDFAESLTLVKERINLLQMAMIDTIYTRSVTREHAVNREVITITFDTDDTTMDYLLDCLQVGSVYTIFTDEGEVTHKLCDVKSVGNTLVLTFPDNWKENTTKVFEKIQDIAYTMEYLVKWVDITLFL